MEGLNTKINFQELLVNLLSKLSEREQEVLKQRYHLTSELEKRSTLKQIGDIYNITRERVRQIEREAIRKLTELSRAEEFAGELKRIEESLIRYFERQGGVVREDQLLDKYVAENHQFDFLHTNAFLFAMEQLFDGVVKVDDHEYFYSIWTLKELNLDKVVELIAKIESDLREGNKVKSHEEILALAETALPAELKSHLSQYLQKHTDLELLDLLESYLFATLKIEKNILDQWGLAENETIRPRKLSDKINLVFQKINEPLHFRDIAAKINDAKFDHKKICAATVHNELIANNGFVLIGRGIYALKDWGYSTGTVADIITKILADSGTALPKDEIFDSVLKQRKVNKSTIYLTLINKDKFARTADGKFELK